MNLEPGDPVLYMKVGTHAQESLTDILARKKRRDIQGWFRHVGLRREYVPSTEGGTTFRCCAAKVNSSLHAANAIETLCAA